MLFNIIYIYIFEKIIVLTGVELHNNSKFNALRTVETTLNSI